MAKTTEAQQRATNKFIKNNYDDVRIRIVKGSRDKLKEVAAAKGYDGMQPYIIALIEADSGLQLTKEKE